MMSLDLATAIAVKALDKELSELLGVYGYETPSDFGPGKRIQELQEARLVLRDMLPIEAQKLVG